jgi:hypothetical protein
MLKIHQPKDGLTLNLSCNQVDFGIGHDEIPSPTLKQASKLMSYGQERGVENLVFA